MKEPWQIWADEFWRARKSKQHEMAIVDAIASVAFHMAERGRSDYSELIGGFTKTTDAWAKHGGGDWDQLRESLRHEWTDHELRR